MAIFYYAQAQEIRQLQIQIGLLNRLVILNKLRILPGRLNEKFRPNSAGVSDWRVQPQIIQVSQTSRFSSMAQARKTRQLQNQNTFLNCLAILNIYQILSER